MFMLQQPPEESKSDMQAYQDRVIKAFAAKAEKEFPDLADRPLEKWFISVEAESGEKKESFLLVKQLSSTGHSSPHSTYRARRDGIPSFAREGSLEPP